MSNLSFAYQHCRSHSDEYCISAIIRSGNSCKQGQFWQPVYSLPLYSFGCVQQKTTDIEKGDLGDAVRASMSFPAMFKPIEIDSILAYDGGIYNNFPVNVMRDTFHPDIIIGSAVSANPGKPKEGDIMGQLENMIMQKTDYSLPDSLGILMTFKYDDVNLMDFQRFDELHDIGYKRAIEMMDSIKAEFIEESPPNKWKLNDWPIRAIYRISVSKELI